MMLDMTKGNISKHVIYFSIPLILGNLFQLTYNAVDSIVVGKYAGMDSLAAVGAANPIMNIVILGVTGICIGASVLMSEFFGAKDYVQLKREVAATLWIGGIFSVLIVIIGLLSSEAILSFFDVPEEILESSCIYLHIIFWGMPFTCLYNVYSAAMRSVGDAKTPIKFLAFSSVLNAGLDYIFIAKFQMGIIGAGAATVLAESMSAFLCIGYVYKKVPILRLTKKEMKIEKTLIKRTLQQGSITALQQSCQPIGKLLIQGVINPLGVEAIAAFNAVGRIDDFAFTPEQSIASAMMTFLAQNRGAKKTERLKKGFFHGLFIEIAYWIIICSVILVFRKNIMLLFGTKGDEKMIEIGVQYLGYMAVFYVFPAFTNALQGYFRGMGNMLITLVSTLIQISVRVLFVFFFVPSMGILGAAFASVIGWCCMLLLEVPYYFYYNKRVCNI